jgi:hypothetical protein
MGDNYAAKNNKTKQMSLHNHPDDKHPPQLITQKQKIDNTVKEKLQQLKSDD